MGERQDWGSKFRSKRPLHSNLNTISDHVVPDPHLLVHVSTFASNMGKLKSTQFKPIKSQPLAQQIEDDQVVRPKVKKNESEKIQVRRQTGPFVDSHFDTFTDTLTDILSDTLDNTLTDTFNVWQVLDARTARKMVRNAKRQQKRMEEEFGVSSEPAEDGDATGEDLYQDLEIEKGDERNLEFFMKAKGMKQKTLADYIEEKLQERERQAAGKCVSSSQAGSVHVPPSQVGSGHVPPSQVGSVKLQKLNPRVTELYRGVGEVMSKYRSGKIPKAFKIIPSLNNWEQILELTSPDSWTAASMYAATRVFVSNLKERMAQRFFNLILLPRVRDDIAEYKRLNYHLYQALRKALFKPGAFMKGILLPLCESGDCTLRESVIIGSVISKNSIPLLHSAAAILKISEMEYSGSCSIFLHVLIRKNYALPYRVIDALVDHMIRFRNDKRDLPVLWHQTLLCFIRHYKSDISTEQRDSILDLIKVKSHWQLSDVIRKELFHAKLRDEEVELSHAKLRDEEVRQTESFNLMEQPVEES